MILQDTVALPARDLGFRDAHRIWIQRSDKMELGIREPLLDTPGRLGVLADPLVAKKPGYEQKRRSFPGQRSFAVILKINT